MMDTTTINTICERQDIETQIKNILCNFDENCKTNPLFKKGIYIYGSPGSGKTEFIKHLLKDIGYDIIKYDAGDVRNKALIETITNNNISNCNVLNLMSKVKRRIAIVMDEIDGMNNGDKGGITALIKLIRRKKTKKQKLEDMTMNPIICIGNYYIDKKIKEIMKVCNVFELKTPTSLQMSSLLDKVLSPTTTPTPTPTIHNNTHGSADDYKECLLKYIQGDLRKLKFVYEMISKNPAIFSKEIIENIFHVKSYNEDSKKITQTLLHKNIKLEDHVVSINETDRTIVALLWHENIVDLISSKDVKQSFPFYSRILDNMCFADYIDRITFQHQIWQFNEMSSLIKTFYNNKIYHEEFPKTATSITPPPPLVDVRFTKILTKYSTEYNNAVFIYNLTQELDMDKKDLITFFQELRLYMKPEIKTEIKLEINTDTKPENPNYEEVFENYEITKLDIRRMYRYLDKNIKKEVLEEDVLEEGEYV